MLKMLNYRHVETILLFGLLLLFPVKNFAQISNFVSRLVEKPQLIWEVRIYPRNKQYLEAFFDSRNFRMHYISTDVRYNVEFYTRENKFLGSEEFIVPNNKLRSSRKTYRYYPKIPYTGVGKIKVGGADFKTEPLEMFFHLGPIVAIDYCKHSQSLRDSGNLKEGETIYVNWDLLTKTIDEKLYTYPYLIRKTNGRIRPPGGYEWVNNDLNDQSIKILPGLVAFEEGLVRPRRGYRWVNPNDFDNFQVEIIPGLIQVKEGSLRPDKGYDWVDPKNPENFCVIRTQK